MDREVNYMAVYSTPVREERVVERDSGSSAGAWALVAILAVVLALILFGSNIFSGIGRNDSQPTDINIRGNFQTPTPTPTQTPTPDPAPAPTPTP